MKEAAAATTLSTIITNDMLSGVLNEIVGLLPAFIALRKGIAFVQSILHSA